MFSHTHKMYLDLTVLSKINIQARSCAHEHGFFTISLFAFCLSPSRRTWMLWPTRPDIWKESARPAQIAFAAVANAIARYEPVTVGVPPGKELSARTLLDGAGISIVVIEQDDAWIRDTGPLFVVDSACSATSDMQRTQRHVRGVDWSFNAWGGGSGGCYSSWTKDNAIASTVLGLVGAGRYKANMVLEVVFDPVRKQ